jgi:hypothetical protein
LFERQVHHPNDLLMLLWNGRRGGSGDDKMESRFWVPRSEVNAVGNSTLSLNVGAPVLELVNQTQYHQVLMAWGCAADAAVVAQVVR